MKRTVIGLTAVVVAILIGVVPVFAQQGTGNERTVTPVQRDPTPRIEKQVESTAQFGIPPALSAVSYRRCPVDGQRLKHGQPIVFEGKVYRFCCKNCVEKFWEHPSSVALKLNGNQETPLTITNVDGKCHLCEEPASREFCRLSRNTISFFCSSACRDKNQKGHRTTVSRPKNPEATGK